MLENFALWFLVASFIGLAGFQLSLAMGAKLGEFAFGGANPGRLPRNFRLASSLSALVAVALSGHYLAEIGIFVSLLDSTGRTIANWVFFGFLALNTIANNVSKSRPERLLWGPISLAMAASALIVAL